MGKKKSKETRRKHSLAIKRAWRRRKLEFQETQNHSQQEQDLKEVQKPRRKDMLTLFILFFPSILIAIMPKIEIALSFDWGIVIKTLLCFYQFVIIKNFVDDFYRY